MPDFTQLLAAAAEGDPAAANDLFPLVYDQLRRLAADRLRREAPGQTLSATSLVHEAYLKLLGADGAARNWNGRGHFFRAAAAAMRNILVDRARRKQAARHGGARARVAVDLDHLAEQPPDDELIALDEALTRLAEIDPDAAAVVNLRHFAGLTLDETAAALGTSPSTVGRQWRFARAWLFNELRPAD